MVKKVKLDEIIRVLENDITTADDVDAYRAQAAEKKNRGPHGSANIAKAYNKINSSLDGIYERFGNIEKLMSGILKESKNYMVDEEDDWFDRVTIKRNEQELQKRGGEFIKTYSEVKNAFVRLQALHEEIGFILNRYFDLDEACDVNKNAKKRFKKSN